MTKEIEAAVEAMVAPLLAPGTELVDVEFVKERDYFLRVYIDKAGGVELDDCQALSEKLELELDKRDIIPMSYTLEVSSPGLDRVLRKDRDFAREAGKDVEISLYEPLDGEKIIVGKLTGLTDDGRAVRLADREPIDRGKIARIRLYIDI